MKKTLHILVTAAVAVGLMALPGMAKGERAERGWLGVYTQSVDYDVAEAFDLGVKYGAVINGVVEDSPAEKAGLEENDVIVALNGKKVTDADDLTDLMSESRPGEKLEITVVRDGEEMSISAKAGEAPMTGYKYVWKDKDKNKSFRFSTRERPFMGVQLDNLTEQLGDYFGVRDGEGALISSVEKDSPADKAGLEAGDVIISVDGDKVGDAEDVSDIVRDHEIGDRVTVTAVRNQRAGQYQVTLGKTEGPSFGNIPMPDLSTIKVPKLKGLHNGVYVLPGDEDVEIEFDTQEFTQEMKDLVRELQDLKIEIGPELQSENSEFRKELEELRRELKQLKTELKQELKDIHDRLD